MEGIAALVVTALLVSFAIRWAAVKMRLPMPTRIAVITVFVLVALTLYGSQLPD
ncbi:hypothetical protein [Actinomadura sp. WMMB 499]|uniref:hypothetical protein n=1 Tax=Actinomadura sp. WMMB 499 TaxID=1219491 RepID=UPI00159D2610|nr:hypothetical protein [Actinomadura sp. WMMB 499]